MRTAQGWKKKEKEKKKGGGKTKEKIRVFTVTFFLVVPQSQAALVQLAAARWLAPIYLDAMPPYMSSIYL